VTRCTGSSRRWSGAKEKDPLKIFGIGLAKTGTTSLNAALRILGYSAIDYPLDLGGIDEHDAATDMPVADKFEFLDQKYPRSKFIYTVRQQDEWLRSCKRHWSEWHDNGRDMRPAVIELLRRLYGTVDFDANLFAEAYVRHETRVLSYFRDRADDLLILDICSKGDGWEPLCSFLGQEVPDGAFPHENKRKSPFERYLERSPTTRQMHRIWRKTRKKTSKVIRFITFRR
jgi:hypothetical protein